MIGIEAAQKVLVGLPGTARVLDSHKSRNQPQNLSRSALRLKEIFFIWNELLRGRGVWAIGDDRHFRHIQLDRIRIVREHRTYVQHDSGTHYDQPAMIHAHPPSISIHEWTDETSTTVVRRLTHQAGQTLVAWRFLFI